MKKQLILLSIVLGLLLGGSAFAQGTADIGAGKGATVKSADGEFSLNLNGRIQFRWTYTDFDSDSDKESVSAFTAERIRIGIKGHLFKVWKYEWQADFGKGGAALKDGVIEWAKHRQANIKVGQFKTAFDRSQLTSSGRQMFVDRSSAAGAFGVGRDVGVMVHGHAVEKKVQYNAGVYAGEGEGSGGSAKPQHESGHLVVARISVNPNGDFGLAESDIKKSDRFLWFIDVAAAMNNDLLSTSTKTSGGGASGGGSGLFTSSKATSEADDTRYVAGIGCRWNGLYASGEYYTRNMDTTTITTTYDATGAVTSGPTTTTTDVDSKGYYAQAGYMLVPEKWEVAARYSFVDPNSDIDENESTEVTLGVNRFLRKMGHGLKITADIAQLKSEATDMKDLRGRLQVQLVF